MSESVYTRSMGSTRETYNKRPYKKSRTGCKDCKARRIKCDEKRPSCTNCRRRFTDTNRCEYDSPQDRGLSSLQSPPITPAQANTQFTPSISCKPFATNDAERLLELRLMWHYTQLTHGNQSLKAMMPQRFHPSYDVNVPQLAFSSPSVLHALLGVSAVHLLALTPNDRTLERASRFYFYKALQQHREALVNLENQDAETLLAVAVLIVYHTWLSEDVNGCENPRAVDLRTYRMCKGLEALSKRSSPRTEGLDSLPNREKPPLRRSPNKEFLQSVQGDMAVLSATFHTHDVPLEDTLVYERVSEEYLKCCSSIALGTMGVSLIEQELVTFLHRVPPRFVELLEREDVIAMALYARSLSLLNLFDNSSSWWIYGAGDSRVPARAVRAVLMLVPRESLWIMEWPMKLVHERDKAQPRLDSVLLVT